MDIGRTRKHTTTRYYENVFREYRYLVGGENSALPAFTKFQAKIVMRSTNSAQVPTFRDLRMIALAV